jgi:autotransporter-associated beta strand protein
VQTVDGAIALDPTHPGTKQMINYYIDEFTNWGFDYVKLDFLSHGALEGVHYDTNVTTGIQAYNQGMQHVLNAINGRMFVSESIAPLFPYQYGHSRRIACDAQESLIANTAYTMNSVSYGWWLDNLYQFNDPDVMVFYGYGATTNENQSRLISGAVTGICLDGDASTNTAGQTIAEEMLTNQAIDTVARVGQTFTPVEGNTGTNAVNIFVRQDGASWYMAVFNYTSSATNETVSLSRAGLPSGGYNTTDLWAGTATVASGSFSVSLNAKQSKLFQLTASAPANLQWSPSNNDGVWDTSISTNWINLSNSQQTVFNIGNLVLFDDTVGVPTTVTVNGTVSPGVVTVNSSTNNFTLSGTGSISDSGDLVKEGSSTLTIVSPADFTGPVTISGGAIYAGDYSFMSVSSITITNNATLDFGGGPLNGDKPITVSGAGVNGEGALYNSSYALYDSSGDQMLDITLAGDTTFGAASGGGSRWDLADGSTLAGPYKVTINFPGGYGEWDTVAIATNVGDFELAQGSWGLKGLGAGMGNPTNTLKVDSGTQLDIWSGTGGTTDGYNKNIHVLSNGTFQILSGFTNFNADMTLENDVVFTAVDGSGNQSMNGTFTLNGIVHFEFGEANFIFTNVVSGSGGFVWDAYNHEMILQAANIYTGPTVISNGLTLVLSGSGSIADSALIFFGGSNPTNNSLDVSGRSDQTLTLASGQTLAGIGGINGNLVVSSGATLSPSGTNITLGIIEGSSSTGTITVSNTISLNGTTILKLNGSGINDEVQAGAGITYGGTLNLVNISDAPLAIGNNFQLFNAKSYAGSFAGLTPAKPGIGLAWGTSQLNIGVINVVAAQPTINSAAISAGNLVFSGTNGAADGAFYVLTTTNLTIPLTNWVTLSTNSFTASGNFSVTIAITTGAPQRFYCIEQQ